MQREDWYLMRNKRLLDLSVHSQMQVRLILFLSMSYLVETENMTTVRSVPDSIAIHTISKYKMLIKGLSVDGETQKNVCDIFPNLIIVYSSWGKISALRTLICLLFLLLSLE